MYLQCSHGFLGQYFSGWCFTHQYKNTTQFCFYAGLAATQNTNAKKVGNLTVKNTCCNGGGYGRTLCINGDYYGKAAPTNLDCYYIAIDGSTYKLYMGLQQHGTSVVTWH